MRKAVEAAQVHPFYIDAISAKWAMRIEAVEQEAEPLSHAAGDRGGLLSSGADAFHGQLFPQCAKHAHLCAIQFGRGHFMEAIARQLGVNASYLSSQFNREVGKSLPEYVSEKRIAEAKRLLRGARQLPIGQIAAAVGFSDVNYFTKVFKKKKRGRRPAPTARHSARAGGEQKRYEYAAAGTRPPHIFL